MARVITRANPIVTTFLRFLVAKNDASEANKAAAEVKSELEKFVIDNGELDEEKGHLTYTVPNPLTVGGKTYVGFQRQKKSAPLLFDPEKADEVLRAKGVPLRDYTSAIVDQDKVARLYADDILTDDEFDSMFTQDDPTYAFVPLKG